jgi:hypothetical protein
MTNYDKYIELADVSDTVETAIKAINTALTTVSTSKADLNSLDTTFPDMIEDEQYLEIKAVAESAVSQIEALVTSGSIEFE